MATKGYVSRRRWSPRGLTLSQAWTCAEILASKSDPTQPWEIRVISRLQHSPQLSIAQARAGGPLGPDSCPYQEPVVATVARRVLWPDAPVPRRFPRVAQRYG